MLTACQRTPGNIFLQEWDTPYGTAPFSKITIDQYRPAFEAGLAEQKANIEAIVNNPDAPTFENTILAFEDSSPILDKVEGVFFNLSESDSSATAWAWSPRPRSASPKSTCAWPP